MPDRPAIPADSAFLATVLNPDFWGIPIHEPALPVLGNDSRVLDIGCGTMNSRVLGALLARATGSPAVVRLDAYAHTLALNPEKGKVKADATALPVGSGAVHAVVTSELTPDNPYFSSDLFPAHKRQLMTEIARVTRLGGSWIAYNEKISSAFDPGAHRPPGFAVRHMVHSQVLISSNHISYMLPFGVFEKHAEPIDSSRIGKGVIRRFRKYTDEYTRAIDELYPVDTVIGREQIHALKKDDTANLDNSPYPMALYYEGSLVRKCFINSAKAGRWLPEIVPFDHPGAEERLAKLGEPYGNELTRALRNRTDTADGYLRAVQLTGKFHVRVIGKEAVILPRQELLDEFIDFRDTTISDDVQVRRQM